MTGGRMARSLRAMVFAALAVPLSAAGQVLVTGRPLPLPLVVVAGAVVFLAAAVLGGAERGFLQIAAFFLPVELLLNTTFNLGQSTCAPPPGHAHGLDLMVCGGGTVSGPSSELTLAPLALELLVLAVHVLLTLLAACWLRLAEAALAGLPALLRGLARLAPQALRALLLLAPVPVRAAPGAPLPEPRPEHAPAEDLPLGPSRRRGPPASFALAC